MHIYVYIYTLDVSPEPFNLTNQAPDWFKLCRHSPLYLDPFYDTFRMMCLMLFGAGTGCLYNLSADPNERSDLAGEPAHAAIKTQLFAMIQQHNATTFTPDRGEVDPASCDAARTSFDGFWGPWVE